MTEHKLKTWPEAFEAIWTRHKHFELRKDDRGFEVGDTLLLQEWDDSTRRKYTGAWIRAEVFYISRPGSFPGIEEGFCVMSIHPFDQGQARCIRGA